VFWGKKAAFVLKNANIGLIKHTFMKLTTAFLFILFSFCAYAQHPAEAEIRLPIDQLFMGMNKGDSALVHGAFTKKVTLATIFKDKEGNPALRQESSLDGFLKAVGTAHTEAWSEPIWDLKIQVDGNFAQAWASYAFYLGKQFSHCGVDAFQLFKGADGKWKIFHLADTRQKEGCVVPKGVGPVGG